MSKEKSEKCYKDMNNPELAFDKCICIAESIEDRILSKVAINWLQCNKEKLISVKGSEWQHHNYAGGLIIHICHVALLSIDIAQYYTDKVNLDLIKFCALTHDSGKIEEYDIEDDFSLDQELKINQEMLGHSYEGARTIEYMLQAEYSKYPNADIHSEYIKNVITQCAHCIGAHMVAYGAIAPQMMLEIFLIGQADNIDAGLNQTIVSEGCTNNCSWIKTATGNKYYKAVLDNRDMGTPENE